MHGPKLARLVLAALILGSGGAAPSVPLAQRLAEARRALAARQPTSAMSVLEQALADPNVVGNSTDKQAVLNLLRQTFEAAADQADAAGRSLEAEGHRENARILRRRLGTAPLPNPGSPRTTAAAPTRPVVPPAAVALEPSVPIAQTPAESPQPLPEMALPAETVEPAAHQVEPAIPSAGDQTSVPVSPDRLPEISPSRSSASAAEPVKESKGPGLNEADTAFRAEKFAEAGQIYRGLAQTHQLPADRTEHWAYCRSYVVALRINAKPKTEAEWQSIDAEIDQIRALAPTNWLGEYLRNRAADRPSARKKPKVGTMIVRAASPEEPPPPATHALRSNGSPARTAAPTSAPASASAPEPSSANRASAIRIDAPILTEPASPPDAPIGRWVLRESNNFMIYHTNPELAEKVVLVAESVRREGIKRWSGRAATRPWQPKCEIYLFPTAGLYAQVTGQPADSPGFSTMGMNEGQIISRRVNVRTDHEGLLTAVLPHEITHVILADFFTEEQIPRWADEGMAVMTEPMKEQKRRANDLVDPLGKNLLFPIDVLMKMDYPDNQYWNLYYAQSVSLTRFLVEQGTPAQFIQFLQGAQTRGVEAELKRVYKINGFNDLQARWVGYARAHLDGNLPNATATASNEPKPNGRTR